MMGVGCLVFTLDDIQSDVIFYALFRIACGVYCRKPLGTLSLIIVKHSLLFTGDKACFSSFAATDKNLK